MNCSDYLKTGLEAAFTAIQYQRMADVPILNPCLQVRAVGFNEWGGHCLGVLITPWFMNLMLLPHEGDDWTGLCSGTKINHTFPSGSYEFIVGEEEGIGQYQMCSLFSPMFEFEDQAAAVATAEAVLECIFDETSRDETSTRQNEIQKIWNGESDTELLQTEPVVESGADPGQRVTSQERIEKPMSRRDLLRGAFLRQRQEQE